MHNETKWYSLRMTLLIVGGILCFILFLFYFSPKYVPKGEVWLHHYSPDSTHQLQMYGVHGSGLSPTEVHFYAIDKANKKRHLMSASIYNNGKKVIAGINYQIIWQGSYAFVILKGEQQTTQVYPLSFIE